MKRLILLLLVVCSWMLGCADVAPASDELDDITGKDQELARDDPWEHEAIREFHVPTECPHAETKVIRANVAAKQATDHGSEHGQCMSCHNQGAGGVSAIGSARQQQVILPFCGNCHASRDNAVEKAWPMKSLTLANSCAAGCHTGKL